MLKKEDIQKVGEKLLKYGQTNWEISDDLKLVGMASGDFVIQDKSGGKIELSDLSAEQEKLIRNELGIKTGESEFDENPLIPDGGELQQKKSGKSEYDENPLIPD